MTTAGPILYHFTKSFDTLASYIIPRGFWPQFSLEDFSWVQDGKPLYLAFPCVCFTDLPLEKSAMHRDDYGEYVIGFHENWSELPRLQRLRYVNDKESQSFFAPEYRRAMTRCGDLDTSGGMMHFRPSKLRKNDFDGVWSELPYLKERLGATLQRTFSYRQNYDHTWLIKYLSDEREWRFIPEKHRNTLFSVTDYDAVTMAELGQTSESTHDSHLTFDLGDVKTVILKTDEERRKLSELYPPLTGKIKIWDELPKLTEVKELL